MIEILSNCTKEPEYPSSKLACSSMFRWNTTFPDGPLNWDSVSWPRKFTVVTSGGRLTRGLWWCGIHSRCHKSSSSVDFSLSLSLPFDISSASECLHCVVVGKIADVSEVHVASSFTSYTHRHFDLCTSEKLGVLFMSTKCEHSGVELIFVNWFKHYNGGQWVCYILTK
jgi:hypothetical protein